MLVQMTANTALIMTAAPVNNSIISHLVKICTSFPLALSHKRHAGESEFIPSGSLRNPGTLGSPLRKV